MVRSYMLLRSFLKLLKDAAVDEQVFKLILSYSAK